ncbi:MAG: tetratricopeptide repeat protein [Promethearchaeota archaeon]
MTALSKKSDLEQINDLFQQSKIEERNYNWDKEIEILKNIEKISLDKNLKEIDAKINYKMGEIYHIAADFQNTKEQVLNRFQLSMESFQKAYDLFKDLEDEEKINATLGFINYLKYVIKSEKGNELILLESAENYFNKAKQMNQDKGNIIDALKMQIFEYRVTFFISAEKIIRIDETTNLKDLVSKTENLMKKTWEELYKHIDLPEMYIYYFLITNICKPQIFGFFITADIFNASLSHYCINELHRLKELIEKLKNSNKLLSILCTGLISQMQNGIGWSFEDQFEQKKYFKRAKKWIKNMENLLSKTNLNCQLINALFYYFTFYNEWSLFSVGLFTEDLKSILENLKNAVNLIPLYLTKISSLPSILYAAGMLIVSALETSLPLNQRIDFAEEALDIIGISKNLMSEEDLSNYKFFKLEIEGCVCEGNAILGILVENKEERAKHLQIASKIFENITDYPKQIDNTPIYINYLRMISYTGRLLARTSSKEPKKVGYYQKAINLLLKRNKMTHHLQRIESLYAEGRTYFELGILTKDKNILKKSYLSYMNTIEYCKNKGFFNLIGTAYVNLAQLDDRLGNYLSAADNYQKAIDSFNQAVLNLTYTRLSKKIEKLKDYTQAWNIIEIAKSYHIKEDHHEAQLHYQQASNILENLREYRYEAPFYSAWAVLEQAEELSKNNKHQESATTYVNSKNKFGTAVETFNSYLSKRTISEREKDRISKLIKVATIRERYCDARYQIEIARLESKKGNHLTAAELYNKSSSLFENLCHTFRIEREKDELTAVYYLCRAWEHMEQADEKQKASLYGIASELFKKASDMFPESRMQKLSLGNALYCSALQCGSLFDKTTELEDKLKFYKKIKMHLRESSKNYQLGGFEQDAQWALATSTFFDGMWHLIQADNEIDATKKDQFLGMATNYLINASNIFDEANYEQKKENVLKYLDMIKNEREILTSALNVIEKPAISASSIGIVAPSCPIEISSQVSLGEMQQYDLQTESELNWHKRIHHIYFYTADGGCIYDQSFKAEEEVSASLVAGGLTGVDALIQEVTQTETKIQIIEKEDMTVLLEHGKYVSAALVTEENLFTLRNKMKQVVQEIEDFFKEELEYFQGNITPFRKIRKFIQKIFEVYK